VAETRPDLPPHREFQRRNSVRIYTLGKYCHVAYPSITHKETNYQDQEQLGVWLSE
jgi:hypothetical protein